MIISPPFLLDRTDAQSDDDWLDLCMTGDRPGAGAYPLSNKLCWHGGLHLTAPFVLHAGEHSVRAIADGTVVLVRPPTAKPAPSVPDDHVQMFGGGWSDNGVVVIKHTTEIGEGEHATVTFYSITMHLSAIDKAVKQAGRVYRKDVIGKAGEIIGQARSIHFEIVCDDANLRNLIGRTTDTLALTTNGRTDVLYGEIHYSVPSGTRYFADMPLTHSTQPMILPERQLIPTQLQAAGITLESLIVGVDYVAGDRWFTSYRSDGTVVGAPLLREGAEYELYEEANKISASFPDGFRPVPSAIYELFRLGRVLGPDALVPADVPIWRRVHHGGGQGWINFNTPRICRYSDADFPPWKGWRVIDGSTGPDSRCDSTLIRRWLDVNGDGKVSHDEAEARLRDRGVIAKLKKTICKFPSEWDASAFERRWAWVKEPSEELDKPMSDETFERMRKHVDAMAFWDAKTIGLEATHWRFEPREFIRQFRKCGWVSAQELVQLLPDYAVRTATQQGQTVVVWEPVDLTAPRQNNIALHCTPLNKMMRKYGINTPMRQVCFFGNALQETKWLGVLAEDYGSALWYAPWYGRGLLQMTHPGNYFDYWKWRGRSVDGKLSAALVKVHKEIDNTKPISARSNERLKDAHFPALSEEVRRWRAETGAEQRPPTDENLFAPTDSAGFYWAKNKTATHADLPHVLERHAVTTNSGGKTYYRSPAFWKVSASVNSPGAIRHTYSGGLNGFDSRCSAYGVALAVLTELRLPDGQGRFTLWYPDNHTPRR